MCPVMGRKREPSELVKEIIAEFLGLDSVTFGNEASMIDDLGCDEHETEELVSALEEAFDIEIPRGAIEKLETVGDVCEYVEARLEA